MQTTLATAGSSIRTLRTMAGMTLDEVADAAGVSAAYLSRVETGRSRAKPTWISTVVSVIAERLSQAA